MCLPAESIVTLIDYEPEANMAIVRRRNNHLQVCIQGEVILEADTIDEIRHWLDVLGMTATIRFA